MLKRPFEGWADIAGNEAAVYSQFVRLFATRERANDITNPKYHAVGDVMLPRNSVFHYMQERPGEVGPSNTAPFISNYDKRINIFFNTNYDARLGTVKHNPTMFNKIIQSYEGGHYLYHRTRDFKTVITKEGELLVNNLAIGQLPIIYRRQTVFTPFQRTYNDLCTAFAAVNQFAHYNVHQFLEFKLPRTFPSFKTLQVSFDKYKKFFKDGEVVRFDKEALKPFQGEASFWLLDLYGILIGYGEKEYSLFNGLSETARQQLEMVFTYNGKCWIVNLQTLINLISYGDAPGDTSPPSVKFNYFKRFYLALISLVTPLVESVQEDINNEDSNTESTPVVESGKEKGNGGSGKGSQEKPEVVPSNVPGSLADLYSGNKGAAVAPVGTEPDKGKVPPDGTPAGAGSGAGSDADEELWGKDVADAVFEQATVEEAEVVSTNGKLTPTSAIGRILERKARRGQLTTKELDYFTRVAESYKDIAVGDISLEEAVNINFKDTVFKPEQLGPDSPIVINKSVMQSRTAQLTTGYIEHFLDRAILSACLSGVQNGGVALVDLNRETVITADSKYDVYTMKLQPVGEGNQSTRRFRIPKVDRDGTFLINGVKTYGQLIRVDIPVRKIKPTRVALTSYYDKKIIIERSPYKVDDFIGGLKQAIIARSYLDKSVTVQLGSIKPFKKDVCWYYSVLASRFKEIAAGGYVFNFDTLEVIGEDKELRKLCNDESWVIGKHGEYPILIDASGLVTIDGEEKGYIEEIIGINMATLATPLATININGYRFPIVVVLSYWMGFSTLLKRLNTSFRTLEPGVRPSLSSNEYMVQFADERLVFDRRDQLSTMVFSGLRKLGGVGNFSRSQLDDPNVWFSLINDTRVKPSHFKEMEQMFDQFIDPITAVELQRRKYPEVMDELTIRALEMLLNNEAEHEVEISEQRLIGYERFAGHVYRELVKSTRQFRNKPNGIRKTFDLNPEAIMMNIVAKDSSFQAVEEVNPVGQTKQQEEVTFGGAFGRSDQAMVRRTRGQLPSYDGIISEAGKDSGKVGFISYLTSDAKIVDYAGNFDVNLKTTDAGRGSITANLLYGTTKDDAKRSLFASVQLSQWMATDSYEVLALRTPYDTQLAYRTSELYSSVAKDDGVVKSIDKNGIIVTYKDGTEDRFPIGYEVGKGAGEYHKHNKVTDMKAGDKFTKGKVLAWDECFMARDTMDPNRVAMKMGTPARIALIEDQFTFEDSVGFTQNFAEKNTTPYLKINDFRVAYEQSLKVYVQVGDEVEYDQVLADIQDPIGAMLDAEGGNLMDGLDRLGVKQVKSKQAGRISKIEVIYNGDPDDAEPTLKEFIKLQDGARAESAKYKHQTALNGDVGGNTSVGKSKVYPGTAVVYIYIENKIVTTIADKFVAGNQMKGTVGFIYPNDIRTPDGRVVDVTFSLKSLLNRMVLSMRDMMIFYEVDNVYTSRMINKYGKYE